MFYDREDGRVFSSRRYVECQDGVFSIFAGDTRLDFDLQKYQDVRLQQLVYVDNGEAAYLIYCPATSALAGYDAFYILNLVELKNLLAGALSDDVTYVAFLDGEGRGGKRAGGRSAERG